MGLYPYNHKMGQVIQTDVPGLEADRAFVAHVNIPKPVAADADGMVDGAECTPGEEAEALEIVEFLAQPGWPRNIVVTVAASTPGDVAAGNIVVTGKNFVGEEITETHAITADTPAVKTGALAFKEVTSVLVPVQDGASVTVDVGWGKVFGIPYRMGADEQVVVKLFNKSADTGTVTPDATDIHKNTIALNGTPDALKDIDLYVLV
jgi:hypothetical protein